MDVCYVSYLYFRAEIANYKENLYFVGGKNGIWSFEIILKRLLDLTHDKLGREDKAPLTRRTIAYS